MTLEEEIALGSAAFAAIEKIYNVVKAAKAGTMTAADALAEIEPTTKGLADNRAAAEAIVEQRFPTEPPKEP